jgi:thermostable 8-oxoguanine DNA glycosylase
MLKKQELKKLIDKYNSKVSFGEKEDFIFNKLGKKIKDQGFLTKEDFFQVVRWKSARAIRKAEENSEEAIEKITKFTFDINNEEVKIRVISSLNGVSIPMASSILTIAFPEKYGVIDIRAWHTLYNFGLIDYCKDTYTVKDWLLYLKIIRKMGKDFGFTPREIDKALFMYDKLNREGNLYK